MEGLVFIRMIVEEYTRLEKNEENLLKFRNWLNIMLRREEVTIGGVPFNPSDVILHAALKRESVPPYRLAEPVLANVLALFPENEIEGMFGPGAARKIRKIVKD